MKKINKTKGNVQKPIKKTDNIVPLDIGLIPTNHRDNSIFIDKVDVELAKEYVDDNEK